ncbi:hypothetical protein SUGI_0965610 [Cryptomeria japonica]|uniref:phospholipase A1-Igamma1, chloroplastic-like n=1 Tax=Cryptomeria japonica TaxID=3369 RepID=UPI00241476B0|nr:phospholipase A1-Igamma1, chloroplastic-like [Cryptomeria japonica]GLJ45864.1 hypothetical protein SUGI_0965610 [Cryptomeria japonica]
MKFPTSLKLSTLSPLQICRPNPTHTTHLAAAPKNSRSPTSRFNKHAIPVTCSLVSSPVIKSPIQRIFQQVQTAFHNGLSTALIDSPRRNTSSHIPSPTTKWDYNSENHEVDWMRRLCRSDPSPKQSIAAKWREYHGANDWKGMLDPLDDNLRREIVKYGEFAQATYDAFVCNPNSTSYANCVTNDLHSFFDTVGLKKTGYKVTKYLYATPTVQMPDWLEEILPQSLKPSRQSSNWMGFVAVSDDVKEIKRLGRRDIVIAWRGTMIPSEWAENLKTDLKTLNLRPLQAALDSSSGSTCGGLHPKVENGFLSLYTNSSKADDNDGTSTRKINSSASEQVMKEVQRLVELYKGEELSITITGHSLGASLGLLSAYQIGETLLASNNLGAKHNIPVTVFSFGGPKVGNLDFKERMEEIGGKTLRIVNTHDVIPKLPGIVLNEWMHRKLFNGVKGEIYSHVGNELRINHLNSPYLKHNVDMSCCHNLEAHLHLVDGFRSSAVPFRSNAKRDYSLVNKTCNLLRNELRVPPNWLVLSENSTPTLSPKSSYMNSLSLS